MTATFICASVQVRWQFFYETALDSGVSFASCGKLCRTSLQYALSGVLGMGVYPLFCYQLADMHTI